MKLTKAIDDMENIVNKKGKQLLESYEINESEWWQPT
jgi:hypothetical protein